MIMVDFLYAILGFIVAVSLLTLVHEYGHFYVARKCGVKVISFSIGFGKPLFSWYDKFGTEFIIAMLPIGGYVRLLDATDSDISTAEQYLAINYKPIWSKIAIVLAGPLFNILFAIFAYWLVLVMGVSTIAPVLGIVPKGSVADLAGLQKNHEIVRINEQDTYSWEDVSVALIPYIGATKGFVNIEAKKNDVQSSHTIDLSGWSIDDAKGNLFKSLGFEPLDPISPVVWKVLPNHPAEDAGILPGDIITAVDDQPVSSRIELSTKLRNKPGEIVNLEVQRAGQLISISLTPIAKLQEGGEEVGFIGIQYKAQSYPEEYIRKHKFGIGEGLLRAVIKTGDYTVLSAQFLYKMVVGQVSIRNLAGPISIARYAGDTVRNGVETFLGFLALISISLAVLNMLPIPVLDGGLFVYYLYELITGRAVSEKAAEIGRVIGVICIIVLMVLAVANDLARL